MTDKEILDKYINLDNSCLTKAEKKEVRELIYKHKDAFSLRDGIGTMHQHRSGNFCDRQDPILYMTISHQGRRQKHPGQRDEKIMLFGYSKGRVFCLLKSSHPHQ